MTSGEKHELIGKLNDIVSDISVLREDGSITVETEEKWKDKIQEIIEAVELK